MIYDNWYGSFVKKYGILLVVLFFIPFTVPKLTRGEVEFVFSFSILFDDASPVSDAFANFKMLVISPLIIGGVCLFLTSEQKLKEVSIFLTATGVILILSVLSGLDDNKVTRQFASLTNAGFMTYLSLCLAASGLLAHAIRPSLPINRYLLIGGCGAFLAMKILPITEDFYFGDDRPALFLYFEVLFESRQSPKYIFAKILSGIGLIQIFIAGKGLYDGIKANNEVAVPSNPTSGFLFMLLLPLSIFIVFVAAVIDEGEAIKLFSSVLWLMGIVSLFVYPLSLGITGVLCFEIIDFEKIGQANQDTTDKQLSNPATGSFVSSNSTPIATPEPPEERPEEQSQEAFVDPIEKSKPVRDATVFLQKFPQPESPPKEASIEEQPTVIATPVATKVCAKCGAKSEEDALFCGECGAKF